MSSPAQEPVNPISLENLSKMASVLVIAAAFTFGLGLVCCWISDSSFGVGNISVAKERALVVGTLCLVFLAPIPFVLTAPDQFASRSGVKEKRLLLFAGLLAAWAWPISVAVTLKTVGGVADTNVAQKSWFLTMILPTAVVGSLAMLIVTAMSWKRRPDPINVGLLGIGCTISFFGIFASSCLHILSSPFGGYYFDRVIVRLEDEREFYATYVTADDKNVILVTNDQPVSLARDKIKYIANLNGLPRVLESTLAEKGRSKP